MHFFTFTSTFTYVVQSYKIISICPYLFILVGATGLEPVAFSMSRKRSKPTELSARKFLYSSLIANTSLTSAAGGSAFG